jgi:hypothetical protein
MAEDFVGLPPDGAGKKLRTRSRTVGANLVHEQALFAAAAETWTAYANAVAFAASKHHITLFNPAASGRVARIRKLFAVNLQTALVTGIVQRFDCKRCSAASAGTLVTPETHDTTNTALGGVEVRTGATVTAGATLFPWITSTDEESTVPTLSKAVFQQSVNIIPEGVEVQEIVCREGQGFTVQQAFSSVVGLYGWILVFTVEAP